MSVVLQSQFQHGVRTFKVKWQGGAYIDVYFGGSFTPSEVINVYDYQAGEIMIPFTQHELAFELRRWVLEQDAEAKEWADDNDEPAWDWYGAYIENQRY